MSYLPPEEDYINTGCLLELIVSVVLITSIMGAVLILAI